jgi:hypothetical protein
VRLAGEGELGSMANKASLGFIEVRVGGRKEESCGGCRVKREPRGTRGFPGELDNNMVVKYLRVMLPCLFRR